MKKPIVTTCIFLLVSTILFGTVFVASQQMLRMGADDPQIQMAEDIADSLSHGADPASFMPANRSQIDMSRSLAPFIMIFDDMGLLLESSAFLHDNTVLPPAGTFDYTRIHIEDRFTWQPEMGVRNATILRYYEGSRPGFVLVARSLREIEIRENNIFVLTTFAWAVSLILIIGFSFWYNRKMYEAQQ